jgi:phosphoenolpyruvate-protein kinase (PTS system EI component)
MKTQMLAHRDSPKSKTQGEEEEEEEQQQQQKNKLHRSCNKSKDTRRFRKSKNITSFTEAAAAAAARRLGEF